MTTSMKVSSFQEQNKTIWPKSGHHIMANFGEKTIVVYQALCPEIAEYAVKNGHFGGPNYSVTRMTWIKTSFLWVMYKSSWATKENLSRILAIHLTREGFDDILRCATEGKGGHDRQAQDKGTDSVGEVRLEWDSDHSPTGGKQVRQAIHLGLRGDVLNKCITRIEDITKFVKKQHLSVKFKKLQDLLIPEEHCYVPKDTDICRNIRLEGFDNKTVNKTEHKKHTKEDSSCSELLEEKQSEFNSKKVKKRKTKSRIKDKTINASFSKLVEEESEFNFYKNIDIVKASVGVDCSDTSEINEFKLKTNDKTVNATEGACCLELLEGPSELNIDKFDLNCNIVNQTEGANCSELLAEHSELENYTLNINNQIVKATVGACCSELLDAHLELTSNTSQNNGQTVKAIVEPCFSERLLEPINNKVHSKEELVSENNDIIRKTSDLCLTSTDAASNKTL